MPPTHVIDRVNPADTTSFGANQPYRGLEWRSSHKPEYYVYIFNCSPRTFDPDTNTGLFQGRLGNRGIFAKGINEDSKQIDELKVEGRDKKRRYEYITSFPQPILIARPNLESNEIAYVESDARRFVVDLINPDNLTLTLDTVVADNNVFSIGNDYSRRGIFFDYQKVPSREYFSKAVNRMEKYFRWLLNNAANLEMTDKPRLAQELSSNPDYYCAAEYFGEKVKWNEIKIRPTQCPNCLENKPSGSKFHMTSFGTLCIEQSIEAWRAAVNSGLKRWEDVPDDFRWIRQTAKKRETEVIPPPVTDPEPEPKDEAPAAE